MVLYITLASCAFLAGWLVYRYDMYEREPWYMVLFAVGLGMGVMFVIGYVEEASLHAISDNPSNALRAVIAATHEESARLIVVFGLAIFIRSQFNDPMDGIIYGCLIGLGMAIDESISFLKLGGNPDYLPPNEIIRMLGHLLMGGITGFGVGMFRMKMKHWVPVVLGCFSFSVLLHFVWNIIAFETGEMGMATPWMKFWTIIVMFSGMFFFGFLVTLASEWSRRIFAPDEKHRLWGWPFTLLFRKDKGSETE